MNWVQREVSLQPRPRGCHLVTREVLAAIPELTKYRSGLLQVFLKHTSAGLTINENADSDVRADFEMSLNRLVPEDWPYVHTVEGPDDMPAHVKSSMLGCSVTIPVMAGRPCLGTWQGIYLCEHRNVGGSRQVVLTLFGEQIHE